MLWRISPLFLLVNIAADPVVNVIDDLYVQDSECRIGSENSLNLFFSEDGTEGRVTLRKDLFVSKTTLPRRLIIDEVAVKTYLSAENNEEMDESDPISTMFSHEQLVYLPPLSKDDLDLYMQTRVAFENTEPYTDLLRQRGTKKMRIVEIVVYSLSSPKLNGRGERRGSIFLHWALRVDDREFQLERQEFSYTANREARTYSQQSLLFSPDLRSTFDDAQQRFKSKTRKRESDQMSSFFKYYTTRPITCQSEGLKSDFEIWEAVVKSSKQYLSYDYDSLAHNCGNFAYSLAVGLCGGLGTNLKTRITSFCLGHLQTFVGLPISGATKLMWPEDLSHASKGSGSPELPITIDGKRHEEMDFNADSSWPANRKKH